MHGTRLLQRVDLEVCLAAVQRDLMVVRKRDGGRAELCRHHAKQTVAGAKLQHVLAANQVSMLAQITAKGDR